MPPPSRPATTQPKDSGPAKRIGATHLAMVMGLGRKLMDEAEPKERLRMLCRFLVSAPIEALAALAIRLQDNPREPRVLVGPFIEGHHEGTLRLSVRVMTRLLDERGSAVVVSMSEDHRAVILCCALDADDQHVDALYGVFPSHWEAPEWSLLLALITEAYRQAELVWDMRRQSRENAYIERELEMARQIQLESMPRQRLFHATDFGLHPPPVPARPRHITLDTAVGFEPCLWVGGDYVDALPLPDGRVLLAIADVCGKGLQAALVASSLQTLVRATTDQGVPLTELMDRLNRHLCKSLPSSSFATMLCVAIDVLAGTLEYCCAGHPAAIVADAQGQLRRFGEGQNVALGLASHPMVSERYQLAPGETLLLFTDGVTELVNTEREPFGITRLEETFCELCRTHHGAGPDVIKSRLIDVLHGYRGNSLISDDCTFVVAQRRGRNHVSTTLPGAHLI